MTALMFGFVIRSIDLHKDLGPIVRQELGDLTSDDSAAMEVLNTFLKKGVTRLAKARKIGPFAVHGQVTGADDEDIIFSFMQAIEFHDDPGTERYGKGEGRLTALPFDPAVFPTGDREYRRRALLLREVFLSLNVHASDVGWHKVCQSRKQ
jgi:hypothetical protein